MHVFVFEYCKHSTYITIGDCDVLSQQKKLVDSTIW